MGSLHTGIGRHRYWLDAQAARVARVQTKTDAAKQSNPTVRRIFDETAKRFDELAAKFEATRKTAHSHK